jgi:hypothetical protein
MQCQPIKMRLQRRPGQTEKKMKTMILASKATASAHFGNE